MQKVQSYTLIVIASLIPIVALFAPLAIVPLFIIIAIYPAYIFIKTEGFKNFFRNSKINQVLLITFFYAAISSIWTIDPKEALSLWGRMLLIFLGYLALFSYAVDVRSFSSNILKFLLYGMIAAAIIANIELFTGGVISKTIGVVWKSTGDFDLALFNRAASVMSIMVWPLLCLLMSEKQYKTAGLFVAAIFLTIVRLDSLSSVIGFLTGGFIFILVYFLGAKVLKLIALFAVFGVFIVAFAAKNLDAHKLVGNVPVVPGGASNMRLYIWDYAAKQAMKKPILGWGFDAARKYPVKESDYVDGARSPLPLHPHNNVLHVWLELGLVGLCLFAAFLFFVSIQISRISAPPYIMAAFSALFVDYFTIGEMGYGIWQNWWVCAGILAAFFVKICKE